MTARVWIDAHIVDRNIARYHSAAADRGVAVRAHVKGHRLPEILARQVTGGGKAGGAGAAGIAGIAVHCAAEAREYLHCGVSDVVIAWPWPDGWRHRRFAELAGHCRVAVHADRAATVASLSAAAVIAGTRLGIRIEVNTGSGRGATPAEVPALAATVAGSPGLWLDGLTGYAGLAGAAAAADREQIGRASAGLLVSLAGQLRDAGLPCPTISAGGTPTSGAALAVPGITELCAGAYPLRDAGLAAIGDGSLNDVAIWVTGSRSDVDPLLAGCAQPWAPDVTSVYHRGRTLPGHTCQLVQKGIEVSIMDGERISGARTRIAVDRR